jgi:hypothetical protein
MSDEKCTIHHKTEMGCLVGPIWIIGWLFTVGFVHLPVSKAIFALALWPYYLGSTLG